MSVIGQSIHLVIGMATKKVNRWEIESAFAVTTSHILEHQGER